ncbi:MAG TPA: hypothetical protein VH278_09670 [Burkholderiaceae bacterium]|nr:hypothetical protein [Burkholderiaceae bacterium]
MMRFLKAGTWLALALWLAGCSTVRGDFHQNLQIDALDAHDRPVDGMRCQVGSGSSAQTFVTPAKDVRVRRAMEPLNIECQLDSRIATATVKARRERMEEALLPFGSVGVFVDHLSGSLYAYPTTLHLRVGQHIVLEHGGEAQVVQSEPVPVEAQVDVASRQRVQVAALQPTAMTAKATASATVPAPRKAAAAAPKAQRAARLAKPASVASSAATAKPKAAPSKAALTATAAAAGTAAAVHSAPVNW